MIALRGASYRLRRVDALDRNCQAFFDGTSIALGQQRRRKRKMNATMNEAGMARYSAIHQEAASSDATRLAQYTWLNELPGVVFGLITIAYIVISLISLA